MRSELTHGAQQSLRVLGAVLAGVSCSVWAQEPAAQDDAASQTASDPSGHQNAAAVINLQAAAPASLARESAGPARIEEIVITATKRAEPVRDIPGTVDVLAGADLERQGVQNIEQIVAMVPGVNLTDEATGGTPKRITIRGIASGINTNLTAGTLFGDIPFSDPFSPKVQLDPNPFDMATVEILKGPQGTLFGGTGLNGMIRYVPEAPQLDDFHVKYYTQFSSYPRNGGSGWNYGAMINAPFAGNQAAVRLVGFKREIPGYVDDTRNGKRDVNSGSQYGLRGTVAWVPDDQWKISLMGALQRTQEDDLAYADNYDGKLEHGDSPRPSPSKAQYALGNLTVERAFDWGDLTSQTAYVEKQFDIFLEASRALGGQLPLLAGADDNHSEVFTQEIRAVSAPGDGPWKWLVGAFYYDMQLYDCAEVGAAQNLPTLPPIPLLDGLLATPCPGNAGKVAGMLDIGQLAADINLREQALFGELTRELGEAWELTLGARAYRIRTSGTVAFAGLLYASQNNGMAGERSAESTQDGVSPKASIAFRASEDLRFYFTASRGFRFGGPQLSASTPTASVPTTYKSDSLWNYELGVRSDFLDRTLRIDAAAYHVDWSNPQVYQISADGLTGYIDNVGGAKSDGVELSLSYLPPFASGLSLNTAVSWNRTETTEPFDATDRTEVPVGSPWPMAPRWQTSTTLAYSQPIASWLLGSSLRHSYIGHACNTITCTAKIFGYQTLDLNVFANAPEGSYWPQLSLGLNNLTDERGDVNIATNPAPAGDTITYIAPRALVLRLSGNF